MLQWADELDDMWVATGVLLYSSGYRLAGLAGVFAAGLAGVGIGLGVGGF